MSRSTGFVAAILAVVIIGAALVAAPQAQQPAPVQTELLAEVRLLRQAIEGLAGTNARVQIVFGRLQLQEQRTATATARLDQARGALDDLNLRATQINDQIKRLEALAEDTGLKPEQLEQTRLELRMMTREGERLETERARLMTAESDAAGTLNQEQGRSSDLNRQLDELERQLTKPPR
jgi:DNA repair exonuclease SbcCD ATPase subunit